MVMVYVEDDAGVVTPYEAVEGWTLMEILREYGLPVKAECGGACSCATCQVYIDPAWLEKLVPMREDEEEMLDLAPGVRDNSRLSCQIVMTEDLDGLKLRVAKND
ncbi:MAG: 2Fe-2S iron-sulfur cluster binding domain-containing protein [Rhodospirillales bacterium]|nr:2Fe-2S iron-sulfur cluster binding domain-containing protein [Rhodospirillales bacterium]MCB9964593.1 2Fe-2S iron-sulfur cluster binding domain-containing protein [Rhodospirillales bacterium]